MQDSHPSVPVWFGFYILAFCIAFVHFFLLLRSGKCLARSVIHNRNESVLMFSVFLLFTCLTLLKAPPLFMSLFKVLASHL